jgi:Protein of unknown function (DUF2630)
MDDRQLQVAIEQLVWEEQALRGLEAVRNANQVDRRRLHELRMSLDRCSALLRRRRAREEMVGRDKR